MPSGPTNDDLWTEADLDEALDAGEDMADAYDDEHDQAAFRRGVEFMHRYLTNRERLRHE